MFDDILNYDSEKSIIPIQVTWTDAIKTETDNIEKVSVDFRRCVDGEIMEFFKKWMKIVKKGE